MRKIWPVIGILLVVALSGCSEAPAAVEETQAMDDPNPQVGATKDPTVVAPGEAGIAVTVTPTTDNAYIPYFAEFTYDASPVDETGADTGETVMVSLDSETLALTNGTVSDLGTIRFLVDQPGEHTVTATFVTDTLSATTVSFNATGLYDALNATLLGSLETQRLVPTNLAFNVTGGLGRDDANYTYECTWTVGAEFTVDGCSASMLLPSEGDYPFTLNITDGVTTFTVSDVVTAGAIQASGAIAGGYTCFPNPFLAYNNAVAIVTGFAGDAKPKFVAGVDDLACKTRFTKGPDIGASTPAYFYVLDSDGNVVHETTASSAGDADSTGTPNGFVYTGTWTIPADQTAGEYQLLIRLDLGDGNYDWIAHNQGNAAANGACLIDVLGSPI